MIRSVVLLPFVTGCYTYTQVEPASVQPGSEVRARVSVTGAQQIAPLLGKGNARLLSGIVVQAGADTLLLEVPTSTQVATAGTMMTLRQRVGLARADVLELEQRTLNRRKTTVAVAGAAFIIGSVLVKAFVLDPGKERMPTDPGGTEMYPLRQY